MPQLKSIVDVLEGRILSGFTNIEQEAEDLNNAKWEEFMSSPGSGDEDPAEFAEIAERAGISHYTLLSGIRQGILNLFSVFLYHTFEQQVLVFFRKEVLTPEEERDSELLSHKNFKKLRKEGLTPKLHLGLLNLGEFKVRLKKKGIEIESFTSWSKITELRLIANTVKHAEGISAQELKLGRPDLFKHPDLQDFGLSFFLPNPKVYLPLSGDDIYVSLEEIQQFKNALHDFYHELLNKMESM